MLVPPRGHVVRPSMATPKSARRVSHWASSSAAIENAKRTVAVMGWDGAAGHRHGLERLAAAEHEQHAAPADVIGAHPLVGIDGDEPEHPFVEGTGAIEIVDVENRLENPGEGGHGVLRRPREPS
jgi:hypothetical protein